MIAFFKEYNYFTLSLFLMVIFLLGLKIIPKSQRRFMLISGLLAMPTALSSLVFVPGYWDPICIFRFVFAPEDLMFVFSMGGIAWFTGVWAVRFSVPAEWKHSAVMKRYLTLLLIGSAVNLLMLLLGRGIMGAAIIAIFAVGGFILFRRFEYRRIFIQGVTGFSVFYFLFIKMGYVLFPAFLSQWNFDQASGLFIWGIPLEELGWAMACGGVWPMIAAYVMDVSVQRTPRHEKGFRGKHGFGLPLFSRGFSMSGLKKVLTSPHIHLALVTGISIIAMAWFSKRVLHRPIGYLAQAGPPFLMSVWEAVAAKKRNSRLSTPWYWMAAILLSTAVVILLHGV